MRKKVFVELFTNIAFKVTIVPNEWSFETLMDSQLLAMVTVLSRINALHNSFGFFFNYFYVNANLDFLFEVS